ncbi:Ig-like domain-containing protein, partial [Prochlorococcus sp. AH-716-M06]|nr:Ig-like domain-containing protein [Prochlorococcus sp. AH-716-M06]
MFSSLVKIKENNLTKRVFENEIIFAKTLGKDSEWIITSKSLINYFDKNIERKFCANNLLDAINHVLEEDSKNINIVAHGSPGFIDIGNGYNSLTLEKELSSLKNCRNLNAEHQINLWSCYGGSTNGIRDTLERCLNLKVNASNGKLGKGKSLEGIKNSELNNLISNLPEYLTNGAYQYITRNYYLSNNSSGIPGDDSSLLGTPVAYTTSINENNTSFANNYSPGLTDYFRIRWETYVRIPETGTYYFKTSTDDGQILKVYENNQSGTLLGSFTDWNLHGTQTKSTSAISLTEGDVVFLRFDFFEHTGGAVARLWWNKNGGDETIPIGDMYLTQSDAIGDSTDPTLSSSTPADNATAVATTSNIVLNFSEAVDVESGNIVIYKSSDNSVVETIDVTSGQVTGTGTTQITINPSSDLEEQTQYYVQIAATAFDDPSSNSYAGISDATTLSFTTADETAPTIAITGAASSLAKGETTTVTFTLSESATDFIESDISVSGGTLSDFSGSGTTYTATFTPTDDSTTNGVISVASSKFSDSFGNTNADG